MLNFTKFLIPFGNTNSYDKLILDYLKNDRFLSSLFQFNPTFEGLEQRIKSYYNPRLDREKLKIVLSSQYEQSGIKSIHEKVASNIKSLSDPRTFTITTGHQLSIFGGPLYVLYKIISAINISEQLTVKFPNHRFVPVFWMASEDHDIAEISSINLFGKMLHWENSWKGIAGEMPLDDFNSLIEAVFQTFGKSEYAEELSAMIRSAYLPGTKLAHATRKWIDALAGRFGLVIIDGNEPEFKKSIADIIADEVLHQRASELIVNTNSILEQRYHVQAHPREINLFYLGDSYRERLIKSGDTINVLNRGVTFSIDSVKREILQSPEKFSPNVLMRPLFQESILPNIAYIGGPAEVSYWLELRQVFENYKVPMPAVFLRSCATILDRTVLEKIEKFSFKPADVFHTSDELIRSYIQSRADSYIPVTETSASMLSSYDELGALITKSDPSLSGFIEAEKHKISAIFSVIEEKTIRSQKKKSETEVNQIQKLKEKLFPGGKLQEREESLLTYYLKWGSGFIDALKANMNPFEKSFILLAENS